MKNKLVKTILAFVAIFIVQFTPLVVVLITRVPHMVATPGQRVSLYTVVAILICLGFFRDKLKKLMSFPRTIMIGAIGVVVAWIFLTLGENLLWIFGATAVGGILSLPIEIFYDTLTNRDRQNSFALQSIANDIKNLKNGEK
jgi:hypothetical protein